jgi:DNA-binding Lrp family transcriptional regulator
MNQPDQTDWKIIKLLNEDGRMSSAEISRRLGDVSARTITNRIDVLTKQRIINIRSIVNPEALGYCVLADVFIETEPGLLREVAKKVGEMPQVSYVACATGDTDIIISVRAQDIQEMYDFVTEKVSKTHGIRHTRIYLLPLNLKDNVTWMPPDVLDNEESNSSPDPQHHTQGE